jgi:hypothetical protein
MKKDPGLFGLIPERPNELRPNAGMVANFGPSAVPPSLRSHEDFTGLAVPNDLPDELPRFAGREANPEVSPLKWKVRAVKD